MRSGTHLVTYRGPRTPDDHFPQLGRVRECVRALCPVDWRRSGGLGSTGQPGDQHLDHLFRGPGLFSPQIEVSLGH